MSSEQNVEKDECLVCGDALNLHVGSKPCVSGRPYVERRAEHQQTAERRRVVRLWGEDAV